MGYVNAIGKYQIGRTIGEGTFAKVKLAVNTENGQYVAIKIIDKHMVVENNLTNQVNFQYPFLRTASFWLFTGFLWFEFCNVLIHDGALFSR